MKATEAERNAHIPVSEIKQDISDTQKEIDNYRDESQVLERNPVENKLRIYMLRGRIGQRETLIERLNGLLLQRTETE